MLIADSSVEDYVNANFTGKVTFLFFSLVGISNEGPE